MPPFELSETVTAVALGETAADAAEKEDEDVPNASGSELVDDAEDDKVDDGIFEVDAAGTEDESIVEDGALERVALD